MPVNHSSIFLLPAYKQKLKPIVRFIHCFSNQLDAELQVCFDHVDWNLFHDASDNISTYTDAIMEFIQKYVKNTLKETVCVLKSGTVDKQCGKSRTHSTLLPRIR